MKNPPHSFGTFFGSTRVRYGLLILATLLLIVLAVNRATQKPIAEETISADRARSVTVSTIEMIAEERTPLRVSGILSARSEAIVRAEGSGRITIVRRLGDLVGAGEIIGSFENSSERAAVTQAEGAYEAAENALARTRSGARSETQDIGKLTRDQSASSLEEARANTIVTLSSVYASFDDAIRTKTDAMFSNPQERGPVFLVSVADQRLSLTLEHTRPEIETILREREERNRALTASSNLLAELDTATEESVRIKGYLDDLLLALSRAIPDQRLTQAAIDGFKAQTNAARSSVIGAQNALSGTREALRARETALAVADKQVTQSSVGSDEDVRAAEAGLKQALGALQGARARLEKTLVRSPISGAINALRVENGDIVSPFTEIATIGDNRALEAITLVSEDEAREIAPGARVTIDERFEGIVTRVAPALDPRTKRIEVRIGLRGDTAGLLNGRSVNIDIERATEAAGSSSASADRPQRVRVPIAAVKFAPEGTLLFTLTPDGTASSVPVTVGALSGERITIIGALPPNLSIITDVRGLKDGMAVTPL